MRHCRKQLLRVTVQGAIWVWGRTNNGLRVLHKNRTNRMYIYKERFITRNWLMRLWRLPNPNVYSQQAEDPGESVVWDPLWKPAGFISKKSQCFSLNLKAGADWCPSSRQELFSPLVMEGSAFWFYSDLQLIGWGPSSLGSVMGFTQSADSNGNLTQKHPHRHTQNNV